MIKTATAGAIAALLDAELVGDAECEVSDVQSLEKATAADITFVADEANLKKLKDSAAAVVILGNSLRDSLEEQNLPDALILVDDPVSAIVKVLHHIRPRFQRRRDGISTQARICDSAQIGPGTDIAAGAHVDEEVVIGSNCTIFPGVYIGPGCHIGDEVTLHPNVVLYDGMILGNRVIIHASAVIGADGFGYRFREGKHQRIPHFGTVRIEDDVEIGACTTIDRAMVGETVIGEGTKLDNLVMIGHNCEIGRHNVFVAQVAVAGSVTSGDYVVCGGHVGIVGHVHLGERCVIGSKAGVSKDVPAGETYVGVPAQPAIEAMRIAMMQKKLPEMRKKVRQLEQQVAELQSYRNAEDDGQSPSSRSAA